MTPRPYEIAAHAVRASTAGDLALARRRGNSPSPLKDAMHNRFRLSSVSCALAAATVLAACSSPPKPIYQQEQFDATSSPYAHTFHAKSEAACEAARRSLLSQGYVVSSSRNDAVDGSKNFQPNNDMHVVIEFHVVCADANADGSSSIAYVNAVQDRYTLKKSNTSASVGLSVFGSLSLPIGSSDDALVKTASETIPAGVFYERFFNLVDHFLKIDPARRDRATVKAAEKEHVAPLPEPAPTPQGEPMKMTTPVVPTPPAAPVPLSGTGVAPGSGGRWGRRLGRPWSRRVRCAGRRRVEERVRRLVRLRLGLRPLVPLRRLPRPPDLLRLRHPLRHPQRPPRQQPLRHPLRFRPTVQFRHTLRPRHLLRLHLLRGRQLFLLRHPHRLRRPVLFQPSARLQLLRRCQPLFRPLHLLRLRRPLRPRRSLRLHRKHSRLLRFRQPVQLLRLRPMLRLLHRLRPQHSLRLPSSLPRLRLRRLMPLRRKRFPRRHPPARAALRSLRAQLWQCPVPRQRQPRTPLRPPQAIRRRPHPPPIP